MNNRDTFITEWSYPEMYKDDRIKWYFISQSATQAECISIVNPVYTNEYRNILIESLTLCLVFGELK